MTERNTMGKTIYQDSLNSLYNSVVWTHKIQRTYLEHLEFRRKVLAIIETFFTGASSISTLICSALNEKIGTIVSATIVMGSFILGEILKNIETRKDIDDFRNSSTKLMQIRNELKLLADDVKAQKVTDETVRFKLDYFNEKFADFSKGLKTIPNYIVKEASSKIKDRKDEETDTPLL